MGTDLAFINKAADLPALEVSAGENGPITVINEEEVYLQDKMHPVVLVQPGHVKNDKERYGSHKGKLFNEIIEDSVEEMRLLPIGEVRRGRGLFPPYDDKEKELICFSSDGEYPSPKMEDPISDRCGEYSTYKNKPVFKPTCPKAIWDNGKKPECGENITVAFLDLDYLIPVVFQFRGTQISAYNALQTLYNNKVAAMRALARVRKVSIQDFVIQATVTDESTYYKLNFSLRNAADENPSQYAPLISYYYENLVLPETQKPDEYAASYAQQTATDLDINSQSIEGQEAAGEPESDGAEAGEDFDI